MGIYDRDYYRDDEGGGFFARLGSTATGTLIAAMVGLFVVQILAKTAPGGPDELMKWGDFHPPALFRGEVWRLLTANFLHDSGFFLPIVVNLLTLYFLGRELEGTFGYSEFFWFFVLAGLCATVGKALLALAGYAVEGHSMGPGPAVIASLVLLASRDPNLTVQVFFVLPVKLWIVAAAAVGFNLLWAFAPAPDTAASGAGGLFAAAFARLYWVQQWRVAPSWRLSLPASRPRRARPKLSVYRGVADEAPETPAPPSRPAAAPRAAVSEQLEAELDRVLEKVAREGKGSLSPAETEILLRAAEIYKRRRGG